MQPKLSVILLSALALATPGLSYAKDKPKDKGKNKGSQGQPADKVEDDGGKVTICHMPPGNKSARHTISVGESAWQAHAAHGDHRGACEASGPGHDSRFDALDRDHNGVISPGEWTGDRGTFDRLDANDDGVISRREFSRY